MGLFSFFNNRKSGSPANQTAVDIPENVFIEKENVDKGNTESNQEVKVSSGIQALFNFLELNHESKGYDDALVNPDSIHLDQNVQALKNDLERTIRKVKIFYEDFVREIDFHISSRSRSGMVDTVEELGVKKQTAQSHILLVQEIESQAKNGEGVGQSIIISYTRGFRNGLAAISHHSIIKVKI